MRRLTIDLVLPHSSRVMLDRGLAGSRYCVPLTRLAKEPPTTFIDLRDERGAVVPLLTRAENSVISRRAFEEAVRQALGAEPSDEMKLAIQELILRTGRAAEFGAGLFIDAAEHDRPRLRGRPEYARLEQLALQLRSNSYLWVVLQGHPGERRVLKFAYNIRADPPRVPARHRWPAAHRIPTDHGDIYIPAQDQEGGIDYRRSLVNLSSRVSAAFGWGATDLQIGDPVMQDPESYHLRVRPPKGITVDTIKNGATLLDVGGRKVEVRAEEDHLYFRGAHTVESPVVLIGLRVERRGFLNLAFLTGLVVVTLLWLYSTAVPGITESGERQQIAAGVLLVVPSLLVLFASREGEHPLASSLLAGVRMAMLGIGLTAAAAVAALGGARPFDSLTTSWKVYAGVASLLAAGIAVARWESFPLLRKLRRRLVLRWICTPGERPRLCFTVPVALATVSALALGALASSDLALRENGELPSAIALGLLAALAVGLRTWPFRRPPAARFGLMLVILAAALGLFELACPRASGADASTVLRVGAVLCLAGVAIVAAAGLLARVQEDDLYQAFD